MSEQDIPRGGVRLTWAELPAHVRSAVADRLGSAVVQAESQSGGFSPGVAARVLLAEGSRAFVKAASAAQNEQTPALYRREAAVAYTLPAGLPVSRLRFCLDDGEWVVLVFDDVGGRTPHLPWEPDELQHALSSLATLAAALTPAPVPAPLLADEVGDDLSAWQRLAAGGPVAEATAGPAGERLPKWCRGRIDELAELESRWPALTVGDTLLHLDLRADNLLIAPSGEVVVVDWAGPAVGADWVDTVLFCINPALFGGHDPERLVAAHPVAGRADPAAVDALLCGALGYFLWAARQPPPPGLPTVRRFQHAQEKVVLAWLQRRLPW